MVYLRLDKWLKTFVYSFEILLGHRLLYLIQGDKSSDYICSSYFADTSQTTICPKFSIKGL